MRVCRSTERVRPSVSLPAITDDAARECRPWQLTSMLGVVFSWYTAGPDCRVCRYTGRFAGVDFGMSAGRDAGSRGRRDHSSRFLATRPALDAGQYPALRWPLGPVLMVLPGSLPHSSGARRDGRDDRRRIGKSVGKPPRLADRGEANRERGRNASRSSRGGGAGNRRRNRLERNRHAIAPDGKSLVPTSPGHRGLRSARRNRSISSGICRNHPTTASRPISTLCSDPSASHPAESCQPTDIDSLFAT